MNGSLFSIFLSLALVSGCASPGARELAAMSMEPREAPAPESTAYAGQPQLPDDQPLIVQEASVRLVVKEAQKAITAINAVAQGVEGFVLDSSEHRVVLRVPNAKFSQAIAQLEGQGDVLGKRIWGEDVTVEYSDSKRRLANLEETRRRLIDLMSRAKEVKEVLSVEKELTRVQGEIEVLAGRLKVMANRASLARITVEIHQAEKGFAGPITLGFRAVGWVIKTLFWVE